MAVSLSMMFPSGAQTSRGAFEGMSAPDAKTLDSPKFQVVSLLGQAIESGKKESLEAALRLAKTHEVDVSKVVFSPNPHQQVTPLLAMMSRDNMVQWRQVIRALQSNPDLFHPKEEFARFRIQNEDNSLELGPKLPFEHAALVLMGLFLGNKDNHHEKKTALMDKLFVALDKLGMEWNRPTDGNDDTPLMVLARYCTGYAFAQLYAKVKARGGNAFQENCQGECAAIHMADRMAATTITQYGNEGIHLDAMQGFRAEIRAHRLNAMLPLAPSSSSPRM